MKILCKNCNKKFEHLEKLSGKVEYIKCHNIFKIVYGAKILCPYCSNILKPELEGKRVVGVPIQQILKVKRASDGTRVKDSTDLTKTRRSLFAKAFDEIKRKLKDQGLEPLCRPFLEDTQRMDADDITDRANNDVARNIGDKTAETEIKKESSITQKKEIEPSMPISIVGRQPKKKKKAVKAWHMKISKKRGKLLKKLGFSILILGFLISISQILPEIMKGKESYAVPTPLTDAVPFSAENSEIVNEGLQEEIHDLDLESLGNLFKQNLNEEKKEEKKTKKAKKKKKKASNRRFKRMLAKLNISSPYGFRKDPFNKKKRFHTGIDIPRRYRSSIKALMSGTVIFSGYKGGYGNLVIVKHRNGLKTYYGHNAKNTVLKGAKIKSGEVIAYVGMTGRTTGPHLHFEVRKNNVPIDPINFLGGFYEKFGRFTI